MTTISPAANFAEAFVTPGVTGPGVLTDRETGLASVLLTTGVNSSALIWGSLNSILVPSGDAPYVWLEFMAPLEFWIAFGRDSMMPDINPAAHAGNLPTQTGKRWPGNVPFTRKLLAGWHFKLYQQTGADMLVTVEQVSEPRFTT